MHTTGNSPDDYNALLIELENTRQSLNLAEQKIIALEAKLQCTQIEMNKTSVCMKSMLDSMPLAAQIWSLNQVITYANQASAQLFGYATIDEYMANVFDTIPEYQPIGEKSFELGQQYTEEALKHGHVCKEWMLLNAQGEEINVELTIISSFEGEETVLFVFLKDMREHIETINKLHESNEYSKIMLDASPIGAMIWNEDLIPIDCNTAMSKTFGLAEERSEFLKNLHKLYPEFQPDGVSSLQRIQEQLQKAFTEGYAEGPWMGISLDGKEVPTEATAVRTKHNDQYMVVVFYRDLREIEESTKKAQAAEKRTEAILNGVPLGINMFNSQMELIDCNEEAIRIIGFPSREVFFEKAMQSFPEVQADGTNSHLFIQEKFAQAIQTGKSRFELLSLDANQEPFFIDVTLVRVNLQEEYIIIAYCNDLRETKNMLKEIELSRETAEKSAKAKSEFLANMSHEIRTPMNGILGLLRILSSTQLDDAQQSYLQKALFSTNELLRIINDILDLSKIEAGKLELEIIPFTIENICTEIKGLYSHSISDKRLEYNINVDKYATTPLLGDPLRLKQVLFNLVNNAIKFTDQGSVSLDIQSIQHSDDTLECQFTVKDTGIGLSTKQVESLFSAFTQADSSVTRKYGGTGLGLAISKKIVNLMQGRIWVESTLGKGSSFFFTAIFAIADNSSVIEKNVINPIQERPLCSGHILLVEDNHINQIIAEELLLSFGYTLEIANNGQEALDMLKVTKFDIVLMDIQMPILDGLSATEAIRKNPDFAQLPIIAMSAHAMAGDKEKSLRSGMNEHITKPISPDILYTTVDYWIKK